MVGSLVVNVKRIVEIALTDLGEWNNYSAFQACFQGLLKIGKVSL